MSDFLKINRNGLILEIALDRTKANALGGTVSRHTSVQYRGYVLLYNQPDRKHR